MIYVILAVLCVLLTNSGVAFSKSCLDERHRPPYLNNTEEHRRLINTLLTDAVQIYNDHHDKDIALDYTPTGVRQFDAFYYAAMPGSYRVCAGYGVKPKSQILNYMEYEEYPVHCWSSGLVVIGSKGREKMVIDPLPQAVDCYP